MHRTPKKNYFQKNSSRASRYWVDEQLGPFLGETDNLVISSIIFHFSPEKFQKIQNFHIFLQKMVKNRHFAKIEIGALKHHISPL